MIADAPPAFGVLLSRYRAAAGLTQEELAERAGLSVEAVGALERGVRTRPRLVTVAQLAAALKLSPNDRAILDQAARAVTTASRDGHAPPDGDYLGAIPPRPLVAREEERERIRAVLDAVAGGAGQLLLLSGEAGVGKTRLAQEAMVEARVRDAAVLTGRCYASQQATPYYPFLEALGGIVAGAPASTRAEVRRRWTKVEKLMGGSAYEDAEPAGGAVEDRQVAEAVSDLLLFVAQAVPIALLLDDLHWADRPSLRLLHQLAHAIRGARILLAGTFRDMRLGEAHPDLAQLLRDLTRERVVERIGLRRFSLDETTALVGATMGRQEVSEEFAGFVQRRTKGNARLVDQLVRSLGGRLELQGEIGAGAMGRVFRAFDRATNTIVAAKLVLARAEIDLDALLRFQQEGAVLAALSHPNIVRIHDTFAEEHASCIIMELLDGPSLGQILRDGPLPLPRAKHLTLQVVAALAYAHGQGIVHRDIKPDNIMVLEGDRVKVTDFGIARLLQPDTSLQTIATTGMRLGTPLYMAPEQIEGRKVDGRTDIYAVGALLFHMVCGRPPFEGGEALAVAIKHLQDDAPPASALNPAVPADWEALIGRALEKDPTRRFQSAEELARAVAALGEEVGTGARRSERSRGDALDRSQSGTRPRWVAAVGVLLVTLVAAVVATWVHASITSRPASLGARVDSYLSGLAAHGQLSGSVLVARRGEIVLEQGYSLADRAQGVPNTPDTSYPVGGLSASLSVLGTLQLIQRGVLAWQTPICRYIAHCPASWRPITVRMVLDGTSHLPDYSSFLGHTGHTTQQSLAGCQAEPLDGAPGASIDYQDCDGIVLGSLIEQAAGMSWGRYMSAAIFAPAGMRHSGRMTDALARSARLHDYDGRALVDTNVAYDDVFVAYTTAHDVYAYDNALFAGKLLAQSYLNTILTPGAITPLDPRSQGIDGSGGIHPAGGYLAPLDPGSPGIDLPRSFLSQLDAAFDHRVAYTVSRIKRYGSANLRLPDMGVTVVVVSNDDRNDVAEIALRVAVLVVGQRLGPPHPTAAPVIVPATKVVRATVKLSTGSVLPMVTTGALWASLVDSGKLVRVDTTTGKVASIVTVTQQPGVVNGDGPFGVVSWHGQVWTTDDSHNAVARIDPATGRVVEKVVVGVQAGELAVAGDSLWIATGDVPVRAVVRVDLRTKKVVATLHDAGAPYGILATTSAVWVSDHDTAQVLRIDPATNRVVARIAAGTNPQELALGASALWVANGFGHYLTRIDPITNQVIATITLDRHGNGTDPWNWCACHSVIVADGVVWAIAHDKHALLRIDPRTNRVTSTLTLAVAPDGTPMEPFNVVGGAGSLWVTADPQYLIRIDPRAMP